MRYQRIIHKYHFLNSLDHISKSLFEKAPAYALKSITIYNDGKLCTYWHIAQHDFNNGPDPYPNLKIDQGNIAYSTQVDEDTIEYYLYDEYPIQEIKTDGH